jgi:chromosome segregation ATPase
MAACAPSGTRASARIVHKNLFKLQAWTAEKRAQGRKQAADIEAQLKRRSKELDDQQKVLTMKENQLQKQQEELQVQINAAQQREQHVYSLQSKFSSAEAVQQKERELSQVQSRLDMDVAAVRIPTLLF